MDRSRRSVAARFMLVQPEEVARTWTDAEITKVLAKFLRIWAGTVDGEVDRLDITTNGSEPTSSPSKEQ